MNPKQNFLEILKRGKPEALVRSWEPFGFVFDPLLDFTNPISPGQTAVDPWGVTVNWGEDEPGSMPIINDHTKVCRDVTNWRNTVKAPDVAGADIDWSESVIITNEFRKQDKLTMHEIVTGLFEQLHFLLGFEDTLMNFLLEPDAMHELLDYITEFKLTYCKLLVDNLHPDSVLFHDDWGSKKNLFVSAEIWREFFKPRYARIYGYLKENDVILVHHADCHCELIVQDMVDLGIDVWQGVTPENNIPAIQKKLEGKLILMGGIDASLVDRKDYNEETIRKEVRRACDDYVPGGSFIPCLTYGEEGSIYPGVNDIIMDEIGKISHKYF